MADGDSKDLLDSSSTELFWKEKNKINWNFEYFSKILSYANKNKAYFWCHQMCIISYGSCGWFRKSNWFLKEQNKLCINLELEVHLK